MKYKFFTIVIASLLFLCSAYSIHAATKAAINLAGFWGSNFQQAVNEIGPGGGVNIMACPADIPQLNQALQRVNTPIHLWIRGHWMGDSLTPELARDWALALKALDTKYKVYFFPVNEPNGAQENDSTRTPGTYGGMSIESSPLKPLVVRNYTDALISEFTNAGILNSKVYLISPTIDPFASSDQNHEYIRQLGAGYFNQFYGVSLSIYGQYDTPTEPVASPNAKNGLYKLEQAFIDNMNVLNKPVFIESGVLCNMYPMNRVVYGKDVCGGRSADDLIENYFTLRSENGWSGNFFGPSILFYNPDTKDFNGKPITDDQEGWIYGSKTLDTMKKKFSGNVVESYTGGADQTALAELIAKKNSGGLQTCAVDEPPEEIDPSQGDANVAEQLPKRIRALLQAAGIVNLEGSVRETLASLVPGAFGVLPNFELEKNVLEKASPGLLPQKFQLLKTRTQTPEVNRTGIKIDNSAAPGTLVAGIRGEFLEAANSAPKTDTTIQTDDEISGKTTAYTGTNKWSKPLKSYNSIFESIAAKGELNPDGNSINLRNRPKILKPGYVGEVNGNGKTINSTNTQPSGEVNFIQGEESIPLIVRGLADILLALNLVPDEEGNIDRNTREVGKDVNNRLVSKNYISDFTDPKDKEPGKNTIKSKLPKAVQPNFSQNSQLDNPYSGPAEIKKISLVSQEAAGLKDGYTRMFCATLPKETPKWKQLCSPLANTPNTSDWALSGDSNPLAFPLQVPVDSTPVGQAITAASQGKAPACVLQAVKYIETGPTWEPTDICRINVCSAAGPFQITTGVDANGNPSCPGCGVGYCPDAWPNNWPMSRAEPSPCDINYAAQVAIDLYKTKAAYWTLAAFGTQQTITEDAPIESQKNAIILGGDSYFGSSKGHPRLGGCSYGQFVYRHCTGGTYSCSDPARPVLPL